MATYEGPSIDTTAPEYTGPILRRFPFNEKFGDTDHVIYSQKYVERWEDYTALALNTTATIESETVYHIGDDGLSDVGTGCVEYIREYANIPATHYDYETGSFTYPGYFGGRPPVTQVANVQIEYAYYLVGPTQTYTTPGELPLVADTRLIYYSGLDVSILSGGEIFVGPATTPTDTAYDALVTADTSPDSYSIVVDSKPEHYAGGIWAVVTRRTKAR